MKLILFTAIKFRQLNSIFNIRRDLCNMETKRKKLIENAIVPSTVSVEVFSNGTTHMSPAVIIRTPYQCYLFNCSEGTGRFLPSINVRPNQIHDIFLTRDCWQNISGITSILYGRETNETLTIHGTRTADQFLKSLKSLIDSSELGTNFSLINIKGCHADHEYFEDSTLSVNYLRIANKLEQKNICNVNQTINVAYLVELKSCPPHIDPLKLIQLKIPKSDVIAKLKAGQTVKLDDGRVIKPEDVIAQNKTENEHPNLLILDINSEENLLSITENPMLNDYTTRDSANKQMHYIVHFTPLHIFKLPKYRELLRSFGQKCTHLLVNTTGKAMPQSDGIYIAQNTQRELFPEGFPELYPSKNNYEGRVLTQDSVELDSSIDNEMQDGIGPIILPGSSRRFSMRGILGKHMNDQICFDFAENFVKNRIKVEPEKLPQQIEEFSKARKEFLKKLCVDQQRRNPYPIVTFLGTSSAVAVKYRNVSGHLLQTNERTNLLIDCGEGTYGQLKILFGPEECAKQLVNLHAIFITHRHLDHILGIFTIVHKRMEALRELEIPYRPLVIVCDKVVSNAIKDYSTHFYDIQPFIVVLDLINIIIENSDQNSLVTRLTAVSLENQIPRELFSTEEWNLRTIRAMQVPHTKWACAYAFTTDREKRKIVFSGDTKPSENLERKGNGADLLIHECTFEDGMESDAEYKMHSTMGQAFDSAKRMGAKNVIFTHFSARYGRIPPLPDYIVEAGNVSVAMDNMVVPFDLLPLFPKLLPVYRQLFKEELFDLEKKKVTREFGINQAKASPVTRKKKL